LIAFLTDEDFNGRIVRGILRRIPDLDLVTMSGAGLAGLADSTVISWAAATGRVLPTHDFNTMIDAALDRVRMGQTMAGVVAVP
jgi:hypothetical protein